MSARLQLIDAPAAAVHHHQPRVFTTAFLERLAQLNRAERALRGLGLHVQWRRFDNPVPQVRVARHKEQSVAPLLDEMGPRSYLKAAGGTLISGTFHGVTVSWMEPA